LQVSGPVSQNGSALGPKPALARTALLHPIGTPVGKPIVPLNAVADFGAGGRLLASGLMCALYERERSGMGHRNSVRHARNAAFLVLCRRGVQRRLQAAQAAI